jgi:hypothetical protein
VPKLLQKRGLFQRVVQQCGLGCDYIAGVRLRTPYRLTVGLPPKRSPVFYGDSLVYATNGDIRLPTEGRTIDAVVVGFFTKFRTASWFDMSRLSSLRGRCCGLIIDLTLVSVGDLTALSR